MKKKSWRPELLRGLDEGPVSGVGYAEASSQGLEKRLVEESRLQGFRLGRTAGDYHGQQ